MCVCVCVCNTYTSSTNPPPSSHSCTHTHTYTHAPTHSHLHPLTHTLTPGDSEGNLQEGEAQLMMGRMLHTLQVHYTVHCPQTCAHHVHIHAVCHTIQCSSLWLSPQKPGEFKIGWKDTRYLWLRQMHVGRQSVSIHLFNCNITINLTTYL